MKNWLLALSALFVFAAPVQAQDQETLEQRAADVVAVLTGEMAYDDVFNDQFVGQISEAQFQALNAQLTAQMGPIQGVQTVEHGDAEGSAKVTFRFERALVGGPMQLDAAHPHKIAGLLLNDIRPISEEGQTAIGMFQELPGEKSLYFGPINGSDAFAAHNADEPMAIGSAFKLYVLSALVDEIANGKRTWGDVVALTERSFPSGVLQNWPEGSPVTLHTLATQMIAISDNTATDQLIAALGRETVEAELALANHSNPDLNIPFLTTRELFLLKLGGDEVLEAYPEMSLEERRSALANLRDEDADLDDIQRVFSGGPRAIEVEWFANAQDLSSVFARISRDPIALEILSINHGMPDEHFEGWDFVGFKGGSEPGVVNFSWLLQNAAGDYWTLIMSWNNPEEVVSEIELLGIAQTILAEAQETMVD